MKHSFSLLAVMVSLSAPLLAHADPAPLTAQPTSTAQGGHHLRSRVYQRIVPVAKAAPRVYYITQQTVTGSNIPVVMRVVNGHVMPIDSGMRRDDVFTAGDIGLTGADDVGTALFKLEPSITLGRR